MSFILRPSSRAILCSTQIIKRQAHKKANIQVKLNQFVEGVGLQDEVVTVRPGLMRNILYPSGKASYIVKQQQDEVVDNSVVDQLEKNAANVEHLAQLDLKKKELLGHLEGVRQLEFNRAAVPNSDHTFGSVTAEDLISKLKEEFGLDVDKSTIEVKSEGGRIKSLGKHQVFVQIGQETAEINVVVHPAA
ncbi:unnamed protein product [Mucor circinelloides]|uniref:50S ribosomal protein L9, chloroplastic n=1 Tax=Mucor circinelloides f. circinelloides (strain 1006PhL) TaxID=1220926 RepID=S2J0N8_MUCC1|nr:50S ribosomal protein L9 [Mucor circinelloides 1006PhL]